MSEGRIELLNEQRNEGMKGGGKEWRKEAVIEGWKQRRNEGMSEGMHEEMRNEGGKEGRNQWIDLSMTRGALDQEINKLKHWCSEARKQLFTKGMNRGMIVGMIEPVILLASTPQRVRIIDETVTQGTNAPVNLWIIGQLLAQAFETFSVPKYFILGGWHDAVVDMLAGMRTMMLVRNVEFFEVNVLTYITGDVKRCCRKWYIDRRAVF